MTSGSDLGGEAKLVLAPVRQISEREAAILERLTGHIPPIGAHPRTWEWFLVDFVQMCESAMFSE